MGANTDAVTKVVSALGAKITDEHAALVAMAHGLAWAIDNDPTNGALWREYRAALNMLTGVGLEGTDDSAAQFLLTVKHPVRAPVGNAPES